MMKNLAALLTICCLLMGPAAAYPALHEAAFRGDLPALEALLAAGADPAERDLNGDTALHEAVSRGDADMARVLLDAGAPVDATNSRDLRPLYEAAVADSAECCGLLLERGAEVDARCPGDWTALSAALVWGKTRAAMTLLEAGASVDPKGDLLGQTPLMLAARAGTASMVEELLRRGADPRRLDNEGQTALHHAALSGDPDLLDRLVEAGAPAEAKNSAGWTALDLALQRGTPEAAEPLLRLTGPDTALPAVCAWGSESQLVRLLANGADPNLSAKGLPCLALAAGAWRESEKDLDSERAREAAMAKVLLLLESGASLDSGGADALIAACRRRNAALAGLLIERGVDPSKSESPTGDVPILIAVEQGDVSLIRLLLAAGSDPGARDNTGRGAAERLALRIEALRERLARLEGMRSYQPEAVRVAEELRRMESQSAPLLELLRD